MDRRIGYGLSLTDAIKTAIDEVEDKIIRFHIGTDTHDTFWGELRDDGWRVYAPRRSTPKAIKNE